MTSTGLQGGADHIHECFRECVQGRERCCSQRISCSFAPCSRCPFQPCRAPVWTALSGGACWAITTMEATTTMSIGILGSPVVSFCPFSLWVPLLKPNSRSKGILLIKGLLGNLGSEHLLHLEFSQESLAHARLVLEANGAVSQLLRSLAMLTASEGSSDMGVVTLGTYC